MSALLLKRPTDEAYKDEEREADFKGEAYQIGIAQEVEKLAHGLPALCLVEGGRHRGPTIGMGASPKRCLHPVSDTRREHLRPLVNRLVGNADGVGGCRDGSPEQLDGFFFAHAELNHGSCSHATLVQHDAAATPEPVGIVTDMETFSARLSEAMEYSGFGLPQVSKAAGISYNAVKKALAPGYLGMRADYLVKAAKEMKVNPEWLATGEGDMKALAWPFPMVDRARFDALDAESRGYVQAEMVRAISQCEQRGKNQEISAPDEDAEEITNDDKNAPQSNRQGGAIRSTSSPWTSTNNPGRRATDRKGGQ